MSNSQQPDRAAGTQAPATPSSTGPLSGEAFTSPAFLGNRDGSRWSDPKSLTDQDWRRELTSEEFRVLRQAGTERAYTGEYWDMHTEGVYECRACGTELFTSREKFDSHCGWPSFWAPAAEGKVRYLHDRTFGMDRVEVRCATCDSHLGHVFEGEGYGTPTDQRYCINSISLRLVKADDSE
ncbi:peptide-methionine (R)-S-oxide reductase MsrB [Arthrobacter sp. M4]|uniref:peptide-methionine (R)-S-oxide reductase MsrB n=1 Tax=Arthrobacter sp. M4 TaxID=218160 RepID=UPI001CDBE112|nr:peptide-methionine (R)-S-oxide reductase MsrB [Arthrobacter sp. M4]MCA4132696.1 peptide-methionine (R)-S-oxide reductase MsrB [Arthrobacter sp. M4]